LLRHVHINQDLLILTNFIHQRRPGADQAAQPKVLHPVQLSTRDEGIDGSQYRIKGYATGWQQVGKLRFRRGIQSSNIVRLQGDQFRNTFNVRLVRINDGAQLIIGR
jgi:hypothetical protein